MFLFRSNLGHSGTDGASAGVVRSAVRFATVSTRSPFLSSPGGVIISYWKRHTVREGDQLDVCHGLFVIADFLGKY